MPDKPGIENPQEQIEKEIIRGLLLAYTERQRNLPEETLTLAGILDIASFKGEFYTTHMIVIEYKGIVSLSSIIFSNNDTRGILSRDASYQYSVASKYQETENALEFQSPIPLHHVRFVNGKIDVTNDPIDPDEIIPDLPEREE